MDSALQAAEARAPLRPGGWLFSNIVWFDASNYRTVGQGQGALGCLFSAQLLLKMLGLQVQALPPCAVRVRQAPRIHAEPQRLNCRLGTHRSSHVWQM